MDFRARMDREGRRESSVSPCFRAVTRLTVYRALQVAAKLLVETEIVSELEEQYFIRQAAGQIAAKMAGAFSENYFTKMKIAQDPVDRFC